MSDSAGFLILARARKYSQFLGLPVKDTLVQDTPESAIGQ